MKFFNLYKKNEKNLLYNNCDEYICSLPTPKYTHNLITIIFFCYKLYVFIINIFVITIIFIIISNHADSKRKRKKTSVFNITNCTALNKYSLHILNYKKHKLIEMKQLYIKKKNEKLYSEPFKFLFKQIFCS